MATSTDTDPESAKKTVSSEAGVTCNNCWVSLTAGWWVSPPNMTCDMESNWLRAARFKCGWLYP